jgi:hypothetical protein
MGTFKNCWYVISIILILVTSSGCKKDKKISTKINSDGSCVRTISVCPASDTSSSFPIPTDNSWKTRIEGDTEKVFVASKLFDNVIQMNDEFKNKSKFEIHIQFEKRFRWFSTYYNFGETYKSIMQFSRIPIQNFLTKEEFALYEKGDTSKLLKDRLDEFFKANIYEEFYGLLIDSAKILNDPSISPNIFISKRPKIDFDEIKHDTKDVIKHLEIALGLKLRGKLDRQIDGIMKSIDEKIEFMMNASGNYTSEVEMPGIIISSNADSTAENKVSWNYTEDKFSFSDFTMLVESRITNLWAIYTTVGVIVIILTILFLPLWRRKQI